MGYKGVFHRPSSGSHSRPGEVHRRKKCHNGVTARGRNDRLVEYHSPFKGLVDGAVAIGLLAFGLALAGILLGSIMQRTLPKGQLSPDSKEVVKLSLGIVATLAALVLGLLVASAKTTYSAREGEINQITAYVILLDNLLAKYGEGAQAARASLRQAIPPMVDHIWKEAQSEPVQSAPFKASAEGEVQELQPTNDLQPGLKQRIIEVALDLAKARLLLFSHLGSSIPFPFLAVLLLWMTILFAGFSLLAPPNTITLASLIVCALSVSAAIFLILGLDQPFSGLMALESKSLMNALPPLSA